MKKVFFCLLACCFSSAVLAQVPRSNHVVVVMEENHSYSSVIGSASMPYLNGLAAQYALATQFYANTHPSIGNYFMLTAGQLVTNNDALNTTVNVDNVVRHLLAAGKTWKSYAESIPSVGYTGGDRYPYARHHNPFAFFTDVADSSVQKLNLVPVSEFLSDAANDRLPDFSFVVPNLNHDAHDCPTGPTGCTDAQKLAAADAWLKSTLAPLLKSTAFQQDGILIVLFDESFSPDTAHGGGHVAAVVIGPRVKKGFRSTTFFQHQSVLRTALTALGVASAPGSAASAPLMGDLFVANAAPAACAPAATGVTVCSPAAGSSDGSPVRFVAAAKSSQPITAMRLYVDSAPKFTVNAASLDTSLALPPGTYAVEVQAWDASGAIFKSPLTIHVP